MSPASTGLPEFKDPLLLRRALTHSSYVNEHPHEPEDNERLEFLGDAVLDYIAGAFLYHRYPEMREGKLTRLRAALVCTEQLATLAEIVGLPQLMRIGRGEEEAGGRQRPTLLCATFEAVIGAYSLDAGLEATRRFVEPLLANAAERILREATDVDPKSMLQEWSQAEAGITPLYRLTHVNGPDHCREFTVEVLVGSEVQGTGVGRSKQAAERAAAEAALRRLGRL